MSAIPSSPERPSSLPSLLKAWRSRIDPEARSLGAAPRASSRIGKRVTQEDVADAIGVSRKWYAVLESARESRVSPVILGRVADALMLADDERREFFALAVPEIAAIRPRFSLDESLAAIGSLRRTLRRLNAASTEAEVLTVLAEAVAERFRDAAFVGIFRRLQPGRWDFPVVIGESRSYARLTEVAVELNDRLAPAELDEAMLHGALLRPGDGGTRRELHRDLTVKGHIDDAFANVGFGAADFLIAHARSNTGFTANVYANYVDAPRSFTELDRLAIAALAEMASLALSNAPAEAAEK